ncbi:MAG: hypothetical protein CMJ75_09840 [Planctomycetaceae bacterium]|nr:hypothetical protein [Planctomycetaceae bacterium]
MRNLSEPPVASGFASWLTLFKTAQRRPLDAELNLAKQPIHRLSESKHATVCFRIQPPQSANQGRLMRRLVLPTFNEGI